MSRYSGNSEFIKWFARTLAAQDLYYFAGLWKLKIHGLIRRQLSQNNREIAKD